MLEDNSERPQVLYGTRSANREFPSVMLRIRTVDQRPGRHRSERKRDPVDCRAPNLVFVALVNLDDDPVQRTIGRRSPSSRILRTQPSKLDKRDRHLELVYFPALVKFQLVWPGFLLPQCPDR